MTRQILEEEEQPARIPGWALTYIDLLWLLLLFFILRSALGDTGEGRHYREITAALKKRFGVEVAAIPRENGENKTGSGTAAEDRARYGEILREGLDDKAPSRQRSLAARGVIYFPDGADKLQSEQKQILQAVAEQIGATSATIEIRGEVAEQPVNAGKAGGSAADPSYARCVAARDYLVILGIAPQRLRIAVGGQKQSPGERPRVQLYSVTEIAAENSANKPAKR